MDTFILKLRRASHIDLEWHEGKKYKIIFGWTNPLKQLLEIPLSILKDPVLNILHLSHIMCKDLHTLSIYLSSVWLLSGKALRSKVLQMA